MAEEHTEIAATHQQQPLAFSEAEVALIKQQIAPRCTDLELQYFLQVAKLRGLNPLLRQIYAIHRETTDKATGRKAWVMSIQVGIDGFRKIAADTGAFAGVDAPVYARDPDGANPYCDVTVYRLVNGARCPFVGRAYVDEYDAGGPMWERMPRTMTAKCAEAQALRRAFPAELSGLYTIDEMGQADRREEPRPPARHRCREPDLSQLPSPPLSDAQVVDVVRRGGDDLRATYQCAWFAALRRVRDLSGWALTDDQRHAVQLRAWKHEHLADVPEVDLPRLMDTLRKTEDEGLAAFIEETLRGQP